MLAVEFPKPNSKSYKEPQEGDGRGSIAGGIFGSSRFGMQKKNLQKIFDRQPPRMWLTIRNSQRALGRNRGWCTEGRKRSKLVRFVIKTPVGKIARPTRHFDDMLV